MIVIHECLQVWADGNTDEEVLAMVFRTGKHNSHSWLPLIDVTLLGLLCSRSNQVVAA